MSNNTAQAQSALVALLLWHESGDSSPQVIFFEKGEGREEEEKKKLERAKLHTEMRLALQTYTYIHIKASGC